MIRPSYARSVLETLKDKVTAMQSIFFVPNFARDKSI